jgi:hypothetical protein
MCGLFTNYVYDLLLNKMYNSEKINIFYILKVSKAAAWFRIANSKYLIKVHRIKYTKVITNTKEEIYHLSRNVTKQLPKQVLDRL